MTRLYARSSAEAHLYMDHQPCACGAGEFERHAAVIIDGDALCSRYAGPCQRCGQLRAFVFELPETLRPVTAQLEYGGSEPSRLFDPGDWLAIAGADPRCARAAIEEALKFVPEAADRVPDDAFFSERGRAARDAEPERFRRDRLEARLAAARAADASHGAPAVRGADTSTARRAPPGSGAHSAPPVVREVDTSHARSGGRRSDARHAPLGVRGSDASIALPADLGSGTSGAPPAARGSDTGIAFPADRASDASGAPPAGFGRVAEAADDAAAADHRAGVPALIEALASAVVRQEGFAGPDADRQTSDLAGQLRTLIRMYQIQAREELTRRESAAEIEQLIDALARTATPIGAAIAAHRAEVVDAFRQVGIAEIGRGVQVLMQWMRDPTAERRAPVEQLLAELRASLGPGELAEADASQRRIDGAVHGALGLFGQPRPAGPARATAAAAPPSRPQPGKRARAGGRRDRRR